MKSMTFSAGYKENMMSEIGVGKEWGKKKILVQNWSSTCLCQSWSMLTIYKFEERILGLVESNCGLFL